MAPPTTQQEASPIADLLAFRGRVPTFSDALVILEACRQGALTMVNRRLTDLERREIACGDVFVFDEAVSGIKRWADGRLWSSSRMRDCFLIYIELGMAAGISGFNPRRVPASSPSELLRKKVLSITTSTGQRLRLVAYSSAMDDDSDEPAPESNIQGMTPRRDPRLANIVIPAGIFHSNTGPLGSARGDAEQQHHQARVASAAEASPSGSSAVVAGRSRGRPSAPARRSSSAATTGSDVYHTHHARSSMGFGGHNCDSAYYGGGAAHYNPSSSVSPPLSIVSAPAPDRASSTAGGVLRRHHDQHSRSADAATTTSPVGSGGGAWAPASASASASTLAGSEVAGYRASVQAHPYAAAGGGAYGGSSSGYLAHHYPPQHTYYPHAYHGAAGPAAGAHAHQHAPMQPHTGFYDAPLHAFDPYRHQVPPPPRATAEGAAPAPTASTTPATRHADTPVSLSGGAPPPAPATSNPYGADMAAYPAYGPVHSHRYYGPYAGAGIRPRYHPHHHHPTAYYGGPHHPHAPPPPAPGAAAPDLAAVINGSGPAAPPHPPAYTSPAGTRASPPNAAATRAAADMSERGLDFGRVHRADSGMYLMEGMAHAGAYLARDHRDRPGAWAAAAAAAPYYAHAGAVRAPAGEVAGVGRDGLARALGLDASVAAGSAGAGAARGSPSAGSAADVGEPNSRSPRGVAAGEVAVRAGVV